jgi:hypothetical protein
MKTSQHEDSSYSIGRTLMQRTLTLMMVLVSLAIGAAPSFSQSLPDLPVTAVESASEQNRNAHAVMAANKKGPGMVYLPMPNTSPVMKLAGGQVGKMTGSIDITSIVSSNEPGTKLAGGVSRAGTIVSTGGNLSVVISSRLQVPSNELERYRMESYPQGQKGGILAGGVMAAFRIAI